MNWRQKRFNPALAWLATVASVWKILGCGPDFPNRLLDGGDEAVLTAPYADFFREIRRLQLVSATCRAVPLTNSQTHAQQTLAADLDDLRAALRKTGVTARDRSALIHQYELERAKLKGEAVKKEADDPAALSDGTEHASVQIPEELPGEFADYFRGAIAWHSGDTNAAVKIWSSLLERPAAERRFRSTWAAYMLGRAFLGEDVSRATNCFRRVRQLVREGYADSLGLAASSLGWEAKVYYDQGRFLEATRLYLEQADAGDDSAIISVQWVAAKVLHIGGRELDRFAHDSQGRRVVTAYLLQEKVAGTGPEHRAPDLDAVGRWLGVVEASRLRDVEAAEQLALAAYRYGNLERTRRWLKLAQGTPTADWLRAKLLLRDGKVDEAAAMLSRTSRYFPLAPPVDAPRKRAALEDSLYVNGGGQIRRSGAQQLWGELGVLRLSRREYTEALDALLRAGFRDDAAYVAEQVLTLDELKSYVDRQWSQSIENLDADNLTEAERIERGRIVGVQTDIRHLLARRLTRDNRGSEARPYYPKVVVPSFDALTAALDAGWAVGRPAEERAKQLMSAARIARREGLELLATALEPDFANYGGSFEMEIIRNARNPKPSSSATAALADSSEERRAKKQILMASDEESRRTAVEPADPPQRYHYRYVAAELGWAAAQLLPDNSDETARILCEAGSWIKYLNPAAADRFYKSLVRRCRRTDIGQRADYIRWFPLLDENGNLRPKQPGPPPRKLPNAPVEDQLEQSGLDDAGGG